MCLRQQEAQTVWSQDRLTGLWTTSKQMGQVSFLVSVVGLNCGCGSSVMRGGDANELICSITILGVSPLGLPLPLEALAVLPPLECCWKCMHI